MVDKLMITFLSLRRSLRPPVAWTLGMRHAAVLLLVMALVPSAGCDKVPLTAPTGSTITLYVNPTLVALNGTAEITAVVLESSGYAVQNGTLVSFATSLGSIDPPDSQTRNGRVTVKFSAGLQAGDAEISASCGAAKLSSAAKITVAAPAVGGVTLNATPSMVPATGGTVQLVALVTDTNGDPFAGMPVVFSTTAGTLSALSAITDAAGLARAALTTNAASTVTVTAGAKTATAAITVAAPLAVTLTIAPTSPAVNTSVTLTAGVAASGGGTVPPIASYQWSFGDGETATTTGPQTSHVYRTAGPKTASVTVVSTLGTTGIGRVEFVVN